MIPLVQARKLNVGDTVYKLNLNNKEFCYEYIIMSKTALNYHLENFSFNLYSRDICDEIIGSELDISLSFCKTKEEAIQLSIEELNRCIKNLQDTIEEYNKRKLKAQSVIDNIKYVTINH